MLKPRIEFERVQAAYGVDSASFATLFDKINAQRPETEAMHILQTKRVSNPARGAVMPRPIE